MVWSKREDPRRRRVRLIAVGLWLALLASAMGAVLHVQGSARQTLETRFDLGATESARAAAFYVKEVFRAQYDQAVGLLSGEAPTEADFEVVTLALGYPFSVLLDDRGRVLNVAPAHPAMIGRDLTQDYEHLRRAVAGHKAMSGLVPSAVTGLPIVAFAVPFDTPTGRRVFSGGFDASHSPLGTFLREIADAKPDKVYLIDAESAVVAASEGSVTPGRTLRLQDPALADALAQRGTGRVVTQVGNMHFTSAAVAGTSWRIVAAIRTADLYDPISGSRVVLPWLLVALLAIGGMVIVVLVVRASDAACARFTVLGVNTARLAAARDEAVGSSVRLAEAQRVAHVGSWEWHVPTDTFSWSDELYLIFGLEPRAWEPSYVGFVARLHPDDRPTVEDAVGRCLQTHEPLHFTARILATNGEVRWIEARAEVEVAADGAVRKMAGTAIDTTERERAREELEASELRFTSGFEHSPVGIALGSMDGRYLKVNPALCEMVGRDEATLLAMTFQDLTHPDDLEEAMAMLDAMRSGDSGSWQVEKRYVRSDGEVVWAQLNTSVVPDCTGAPSYFFSQVQDITQKKALADAVVRERELLAAVLHNLSDGVVACDADGILTLFNRATQEFHGLPVTAIVPDDWASRYGLYHADGTTLMEPGDVPLLRALRGEDVRGAEMVIVPDHGRRRLVQVSAQAILDGAGSIAGAVAAMHDITGRKQAEDDLACLNADLERRVQERTAEAEQANGAKSEFLSRMSHELRTPLNAMLGFAQLLGMDELNSDQAKSVEHIMCGGRHLLALINEVLDLAAIESGHLAMLIEPVALMSVLDEALDLLRPQAAMAAVSLPARPPAHADVSVLADHQRLRQIVVNLLSNAVKYNVEKGTVSLTCEKRDDGRIRVAVTDTGRGIADGDAYKLFAPFERLAAAATAVEGTGLGLAVSKRLADAMGADIGCSSVPGHGSTFWVDMPMADGQKAPPDPSPTQEGGTEPRSDASTVLYIEDNPSICSWCTAW